MSDFDTRTMLAAAALLGVARREYSQRFPDRPNPVPAWNTLERADRLTFMKMAAAALKITPEAAKEWELRNGSAP